jgi:uncharacterized cupredoxin-like copper-binding protein
LVAGHFEQISSGSEPIEGKGTMSARRTVAGAAAGLVAAMLGFGSVASAATVEAKATKVDVVVSEWVLKPKLKFAAAGKTKFVLHNKGNETHEFVVVRADSFKDLPTKADGSVDEDAIAEKDKMGEIEDIKVGKTKSKVFKLGLGKYVLFCNVVDKKEDHVHFDKGMHATFEAG